jgi:type VI secretion system protein ImpF
MRNDKFTGIKLSILDRIIGFDPLDPQAFRPMQTATVRELENTVHRDLMALLNVRRADEPIPAEFEEAARSILTFGLPDFTSRSVLDRSEQERLRRAIETAIRVFEPRLSNVTVSLDRPGKRVEQGRGLDNTLRYHVRALLRVEPDPEPVVFDAVLEPGTGRVAIQSAGRE